MEQQVGTVCVIDEGRGITKQVEKKRQTATEREIRERVNVGGVGGRQTER